MELRSVLAESALFANLPGEALDRLTSIAETVTLHSGERLFAEGDAAEHLYVVATGRLRAQRADGFIFGFIGRLEPIGEIGLLSADRRGATVLAVRDSVLVRLERTALIEFLIANPTSLIAIARVLIQRLTQNQRLLKLRSARSARTFAILPATPEVTAEFGPALYRQLAGFHTAKLLDAATVDEELQEGAAQAPEGAVHEQLTDWLNQLERRYRYLVYAASDQMDAWTLRCMRQADRVLVVARSDSPPVMTPMIAALKSSGILAPTELVLLRPEGAPPGDVLAWQAQVGARSHHFLRPGAPADFDSLVRQQTGRGVGLVLGGGGARGFAHIGLFRALDELKIPVDLVGGSSMGAFIAALRACGYDSHEMMHIVRETFVTHNFLNDYIFPLPRVSLIRGRKFVRRLHELFGDRRIEHLRTPFFCVATNLTRGTPVIHENGPLAMWLASSMCVPGFAPPVAWRGELLVDGAVVNSLPTDIMQGMERGPIIASDVSTEGDLRAPGVEGPDPEALLNWRGPGAAPSLRDILFRTATMTSESGTRRRAENADLYLRMPVGSVGMFDWKRMDELVERGYQFSLERLASARENLLR